MKKIVVDVSRSNPHFVLSIGDFNAKSSNWSSNHTITAEGAQLDYLTSLYGMRQVTTEPTHILELLAASILFLPISQTLLRILEYIHHCMKNVTIKQYIQNSI